MGGHDVFYSTLMDNGEWSVPLNAGYPLNSTDDDVFFAPVNQGYEGYFSIFSPDGFGQQDIYRLEIFSDNHPRKFMVRGIAAIADINLRTMDRIRIMTINKNHPDQTSEDYADPKTGEYELFVTHGDHTVIYEINGTERYRQDIHLPLTSKSDSFILPPTVLPKTDFTARLDTGIEDEIVTGEWDTTIITLGVEPYSRLTVEHRDNDSLLFSEHFKTTDTLFNYKIAREYVGTSLKFSLEDQYGNTASREISIAEGIPVRRQSIVRPEHPELIAEKRAAAISELEKAVKDETLKNEGRTVDEQKELPAVTDEQSGKNGSLWYLWIIAGAGLLYLVIVILRKKNKKNESD